MRSFLTDLILPCACILGPLLLASGTAGAGAGALTQLAGADACVSDFGPECAIGVGLDGADGVTVSPDGKNIYVTSGTSKAVVVFARDRQTGALTQLAGTDACVSDDGGDIHGGVCADGVALDGAYGVAVSPDGKNVYVPSSISNAVAVFARDRRTGALTQLADTDACISETGTDGACTDGVALDGADGVAVSPDGKNVYVPSSISNAVAVFARDRRTGALTQLAGTDACISETGTDGACTDGVALDFAARVAVSPDGKNVYVTSSISNAVAVFARDRRTGALTQLAGTDACISETGTDGACTDGVALDFAAGVTVSPDGKNVYVASADSHAVAVFARDRKTGALTQLPGTDACVSDVDTSGACADGIALNGPSAVTVSPDGKNVYVYSQNAVAVFARDRKTGALTQLPGTDACVSDVDTSGACADGIAIRGATALTVSPDGKNFYTASADSTVAVFARQR